MAKKPAAKKPASRKARRPATPAKKSRTGARKAAAPAPEQRDRIAKLRTLGRERARSSGPEPEANPDQPLSLRAREVLDAEFERIIEMKRKLSAESRIGGTEKGRASAGQDQKVRSLLASLEGMSRFALVMGLITPAESREIYARAMQRGLYEGWR